MSDIKLITIPEEATNGYAIRKLFETSIEHVYEDINIIVVMLDGRVKTFDLDWWIAPYGENNNE